MIAPALLRKGWCPGARRPMQSGDGLLLRIRPRAGALAVSSLFAIAKTAIEFGSGEIDLTNRGNLQLRGLSTESYPEALALLDASGLIDEDADVEAVRNVVVDPLSGVDPERADVCKLAARLEEVLVENKAFWQLPGKFGFSFSGSSEPRIGVRSTDIMISAPAPGSFAISLDGNADVGAVVAADNAIEAIARLAAIFLELRASDATITRMRDAVERRGSATIYAAAGLGSSVLPHARNNGIETPPVGLLVDRNGTFAAGVGLPFGRVLARQLEALYGVASCVGIQSVRTSPQRVLVFPVESEGQAKAVLEEAEYRGLIAAPDDLRLFFDVCPGAPACANATTDTRRDAQRLAEALHGTTILASLHVSGCEKGCARRGAAALTLVARDGRYDVICNDGPSGSVALAGLSPAEIDAAVARFINEPLV
jgi:precorrin-3B synthase